MLSAILAATLTLAAPKPGAHRDVWHFLAENAGVQVEAFSDRGVQLFMRGGGDLLLAWFPADSAARWGARVDSILARPLPAGDADARDAATLTGRRGAALTALRERKAGRVRFALQLATPAVDRPLMLVVQEKTLRDAGAAFGEAARWLAKTATRDPRAASAADSAESYEAWEVDAPPQSGEARDLMLEAPEFRQIRGAHLLASFVVDASGRVDPATIDFHEISDERLNPIFLRMIEARAYAPGVKGGRPVRTRVFEQFDITVQGHVEFDNKRLMPGVKP